MSEDNGSYYPYIPNSHPEIRKQMLEEIGLDSVEDIYQEIPNHLRFDGEMDIPEALSECELERHIDNLLSKNVSASDNLNFLGGGVWQHYVPAICDTIASRDEFLTCYVGDAYADHGKFQALWETASMIGDLVELDAVNTPTYDWAKAIGTCLCMSNRINGRSKALVPAHMSPRRLEVIKDYCRPHLEIELVDFGADFQIDTDDLENKISEDVSAVYIENPNYLGTIETKVADISRLARSVGAEFVVGADPTSLGVLEAPGNYGATIVCGDLQPLGLHMKWGGALSGYIASIDEEKYVAEYPDLLFGITTTQEEGEYGFGHVAFDRTSYAEREEGKEFIGTTTALYGIVAGVYLALMGPEGMKELGEGIMQRVNYAQSLLSDIEGIEIASETACFKEFVVEYTDTDMSVKEINEALKEEGIFGGRDLSEEFEEMENAALFSITEVHQKEDIQELALALEKVLN